MWIICENGNMVNLDHVINITKDKGGTVCCDSTGEEIQLSKMDVRPTIAVALNSGYVTLEVR